MVFDVDARHAIAGGRDDESVVEADFERAGLDVAVPIDLAVAQAEVPLADDTRRVAGLLEHRRERGSPGRDDQGGVPRQDPRPFLAPGVLAREQGIPRRRARGRSGVTVGEPQSLLRQPVDVRRLDPRRPVAADVAIAEVVGINQDDVGSLGRMASECSDTHCAGHKKKSVLHGDDPGVA